ncbi:MAG: C2H2-type zinc finger protein [Candidatus Babeliales bacterium]
MKTVLTNLILLFLLCAAGMSSAMEEAVENSVPTHTTSTIEAEAGAGSESQESPTVKKGTKRKRGTSEHICSKCGKNFSRSSHLADHFRRHTGETPCKCDHPGCDKAFPYKRILTEHIKTHTKLTCEKCGQEFTDKKLLTKHIRTHIKKKFITCYGCNKKFSDKVTLITHIRAHTGEKSFTEKQLYLCETCGKNFFHESSLIRHMKIHNEKAFKCSICGKNFEAKYNLTRHEKTHAEKKIKLTLAEHCVHTPEPATHSHSSSDSGVPSESQAPPLTAASMHTDHYLQTQSSALLPVVPLPIPYSGGLSLSMSNENRDTFQEEFATPLIGPLALPESDSNSVLFGPSLTPEDGNL